MKRTTWRIPSALAWIGLILGGRAVAQEPIPTPDPILGPAASEPANLDSIPSRATRLDLNPKPETTETDVPRHTDSPAHLTDANGEGILDAEPDDIAFSASLDPLLEGESGYPPQFYIEQGIRILTRGRARGGTITNAYNRDFFDFRFNGQFGAYQVVTLQSAVAAVADDPATPDDETAAAVPAVYGVQNVAGIPVDTVMSVGELGFDVAAGYHATVGRYLGRDSHNRDQFIEFSYWGMNSWVQSETTNGVLAPFYRADTLPTGNDPLEFFPTNALYETVQDAIDNLVTSEWKGNLFSPFRRIEQGQVTSGLATPDDMALSVAFNDVEQHSISYSSRMDNFELTARLRPRLRDRLILTGTGRWRQAPQDGYQTSYIFGMRLMSIDERFVFLSRGRLIANGASPLDQPILPILVYEKSGSYTVRTHNDLFGLQFGCDFIHHGPSWNYGFRAKAGPFINFSDQRSLIVADSLNPEATPHLEIPFEARKDEAALIVEIGAEGSYQLTPQITASASYDIMWIAGLALAPEQLQFVTNPLDQINSGGTVFYHGLSLNLEFLW